MFQVDQSFVGSKKFITFYINFSFIMSYIHPIMLTPSFAL
jgi:hypothetical protein